MQYSKSEWKVCLAGRRQRYVWAYALALFCAAITLIGCARASDDVAMDAQSSFKASTPSVAEVSETSVSARPDKPTAVPIAQSQSEQTPPTTSTSASLVANSAPANPYGSPTLDERIFFADAIAIVRPVSIEPVILTVQLAAGQTGYSPVVQSRYEIIEYLKGEGDAEIIVDAKNFSVTLSSVEQALQSAESDAAAQLSSLGRGEAIVFLQRMEHNPDSILDVSRKASETEWRQHNAQTGLFSAGGDIGGASATFSAASGSVAAGTGQPEEYSIDELRERIEAMENLIREGEDIEGWEDCIESKLLFENYRRKHKDTLASVFDVEPFPSGLPAGSIVDVFNTMYWFTGDNAPLFHYGANEITTARPIPVGVYEVHAQYQKSEWIPCDYVAPPVIWRYTFESAEGVLHEAFFDPVHIDEGVGASNEDGVLRPESFESDDGEIVVEGIKWRDEQLEMELSAATDLADHRMDFIALDGSVSLRLDFDNAIDSEEGSAAKLSWGVCEQPWEDGDMLMIRIASGIPDDGVQATNDSECQTASAE